MHLHNRIPVYKEAPFLRLLPFLILGILVQWYLSPTLLFLAFFIACLPVILIVAFFIPSMVHQQRIKSIVLQLFLFAGGCLLVQNKDIRLKKNHFANWIKQNEFVVKVKLTEPLSEKAKSYKTTATVLALLNKDTTIGVTGNIIIYFKKDSLLPKLAYGSILLVHKTPEPVKNSGNPGAFDFAQYCLFKGITHQVFLQQTDYAILPETEAFPFTGFLLHIKNKVLQILNHFIPSEKEIGIAEALLIGYRDNLDKDLMQAYSNTGTIHVIAISGLHLGFIYLILVACFKPFAKYKWITIFLKPISIISLLWIFTLLAGGAPSILRSAIMFTCIVIGDCINRKTSIYNTLACSAFIILCIQPFSLWDAGFQLSYAAVLSIVLFMQPIYRLMYCKNKLADWLWQLNAVTLSAQVLTFPVVLYHFHQFPNLFLLTNMIAVPFSTLILGGELILMLFYWQPFLAKSLGWALMNGIRLLNWFIEACSRFTFAVTDYIRIDLVQCILLYGIIVAFGKWLLQRQKPFLFCGLFLLLFFVIVQQINSYQIKQQQKLIVYHIPQLQAIDIIYGNSFYFLGDSLLSRQGPLPNFNLKASRIFLGTKNNEIKAFNLVKPLFRVHHKNILLIDTHYTFARSATIQEVDLVILSKNPRIYIDSMQMCFSIKKVVADATNPLWKINLWQKDCERLQIPFHSTARDGAFIANF